MTIEWSCPGAKAPVIGCWVLGLFLVRGVLAVRRWMAPT